MKKTVSIILAILMITGVFTALPFTVTAAPDSRCIADGDNTDFGFLLYDDDTAAITEFHGSGTVVEIPEEIDGYTVDTIYDEAFMDDSSITKVVIPKTVLFIGKCAFQGMTALTEVHYMGSALEWQGIDIDGYNASITDETLTFEGAAQPKVIDSVSITGVVEPVAGQKPAFSASSGDDITIDGITLFDWYNSTDSCGMAEDEEFEAGKEYAVNMFIRPKTGCEFKTGKDVWESALTATINGTNATIMTVIGHKASEYIHLCAVFKTKSDEQSNIIDFVTVTGVTEPVGGCSPKEEANVSANVSVVTMQWYNVTDKKWVFSSDFFEEGKTYEVNVYIAVDPGYEFMTSGDGESTLVSAALNGSEAVVLGVSGEDVKKTMDVTYTFVAKPGKPQETTAPTEQPTEKPTEPQETTAPTEQPTEKPTEPQETTAPTEQPTDEPTDVIADKTVTKANPMKVTAVKKITAKANTLKKKNVSAAALKITKAQGKVSVKISKVYYKSGKKWKKASKALLKKFSLSAKGKLTLKKKLPKGSYRVYAQVTAKGKTVKNVKYKKKTVKPTIAVTVK